HVRLYRRRGRAAGSRRRTTTLSSEAARAGHPPSPDSRSARPLLIPMQRSLADALAGCLLGQALGDALGFIVEAAPPDVAEEYVEECLQRGRAGDRAHPDFPFGQYTDDTQLARELLCSLRDIGGWDPADYARRIGALFRDGRAVGSGPGTRSTAERLLAGT